jgi:hypothetical protein
MTAGEAVGLAVTYERALPEAAPVAYGYQGCTYALALGLEARLAP